MAAATLVSYKNPEGNTTLPLSDLRFHRWALLVENAETHATGLDNIVEYAIKNTDLGQGDEVGVGALTAAGVFTFDVATGDVPIDLFVWSRH